MFVCCAPNCSNTSQNCELSFFRFPCDSLRCNKWKELVNSDKIKHFATDKCYHRLRLCSRHFEDDHFANTTKNRLRRSAVPTIFNNLHMPIFVAVTGNSIGGDFLPETDEYALPNGQVQVIMCQNDTKSPSDEDKSTASHKDVGVQTDSTSALDMNTNYKVNDMQADQNKREKILQLLEKTYPKIADFIRANNALVEERLNETSYSEQFIQFAIAIYLMSPQAYRVLIDTFGLPLKSVLLSMTKNKVLNHY